MAGWATPIANDAEKRGRVNSSGGLAYQSQLAGWATPSVRDNKGGYQGGRIRNGQLSTDTLDVMAQLAGWPTPNTMAGGATSRSGKRKGGIVRGTASTSSPAQTGKPGVLNAELPRWLQGFPEAWDRAAPGSSEWNSWQRRLTTPDA